MMGGLPTRGDRHVGAARSSSRPSGCRPDRAAGLPRPGLRAGSALRNEVEALLQAHDGRTAFCASRSIRTADVRTDRRASAGTVIGPYKLLEQIGEGGFGVVFLAEQTEPVRRKVALKVIKPGMDTRQVVARFEAERQALATHGPPEHRQGLRRRGDRLRPAVLRHGAGQGRADHRVLRPEPPDPAAAAGAVRPGLPGGAARRTRRGSSTATSSPPTSWCRRHDTTPVVKVIDFGVAKALGQELTDKTLFTGVAQMVGTPLYMSPEQAGMSDLDVDTRSDIYSLGRAAVRAAHRHDAVRQGAVQAGGLRRDPPHHPRGGAAQAEHAAQHAGPGSGHGLGQPRAATRRGCSRLVRGELDWIVMKALEKDRSRRYETASAFAADVQRYLADEPVQACPPSAWYRFRKFARRNKRAVLTASAVAAAVVLAVAALVAGTLLFEQEQARTAEAVQAATDLAAAEAEARGRLEPQLYRQRIALAEREWSANNLSRMEAAARAVPGGPARLGMALPQAAAVQHASPLRHESPVLSVAFSPDGKLLATGTQAGVVRLWQAKTGQELRKWQAHEDGTPPASRSAPTAGISPREAGMGRSRFGTWRRSFRARSTRPSFSWNTPAGSGCGVSPSARTVSAWPRRR